MEGPLIFICNYGNSRGKRKHDSKPLHVLFTILFYFFEKKNYPKHLFMGRQIKSRAVSSCDYEQCGDNYTLETLQTLCHSVTLTHQQPGWWWWAWVKFWQSRGAVKLPFWILSPSFCSPFNLPPWLGSGVFHAATASIISLTKTLAHWLWKVNATGQAGTKGCIRIDHVFKDGSKQHAIIIWSRWQVWERQASVLHAWRVITSIIYMLSGKLASHVVVVAAAAA